MAFFNCHKIWINVTSSKLEGFVDQVDELRLAHGTGNLVNHFTAFEKNQGGDRTNTEFAGGNGIVVNVHLGYGELTLVFFGEFFDDPFIHLKLPPEELRRRVLEKEPERMDRAGHIATPEEYWQWYTELNRITVAGFEMELRDLGFEPWRVAVRSSDLVEYTPEMQGYPMQDLATAELYLSAWNRKL